MWHTAGLCVSSEAAVAASLGCLQLSVLGKGSDGLPHSGPGFSPSVQRCGVTD